MNKNFSLLVSLIFVLLLTACGDADHSEQMTPSQEVEENNKVSRTDDDVQSQPFIVLVDLKDAEGKTTGTAELEETEDGVIVRIMAEGLSPGIHGFHFHETGICEAPDFETAGDHFNPDGKQHGLEFDGGPHAGDLPNLEVAENGQVDDEFMTRNVTLEVDKDNSLLRDSGTSLVIHALKDDGKTQPSGDSGKRIACGVIK